MCYPSEVGLGACKRVKKMSRQNIQAEREREREAERERGREKERKLKNEREKQRRWTGSERMGMDVRDQGESLEKK